MKCRVAVSVSKSKCPRQCPLPGFLKVGQAPSTFSQITALVCVGQRAYLRVLRVPAKPLVHKQSHFDTQLGPLPPTATAHCCCTHTCEYMCMHESGWLGLGQCKQHLRCSASVTKVQLAPCIPPMLANWNQSNDTR